jgi:ribosomal protein S27AE
MTDRDGKQCERCGEGTYEIADLNDYLNSERHCNKCGHFVKQYGDEE